MKIPFENQRKNTPATERLKEWRFSRNFFFQKFLEALGVTPKKKNRWKRFFFFDQKLKIWDPISFLVAARAPPPYPPLGCRVDPPVARPCPPPHTGPVAIANFHPKGGSGAPVLHEKPLGGSKKTFPTGKKKIVVAEKKIFWIF